MLELNKKDVREFEKAVNTLSKKYPKLIQQKCTEISEMLTQEVVKSIEKSLKAQSGKLKKSIFTEKAKITKNGFIVARVIIKSGGKAAWYWHFLEFPSKNRDKKGAKGDKAFIRNTVRDTKAEENLHKIIINEYDKLIK